MLELLEELQEIKVTEGVLGGVELVEKRQQASRLRAEQIFTCFQVILKGCDI